MRKVFTALRSDVVPYGIKRCPAGDFNQEDESCVQLLLP